jgi:hypothetical protein
MKKQNILILINVVLFFAFITTITSVSFYALIPSNLNGNELLGEIHEIGGLVFATFAILHIGFNWKWIKSQIFKKKGVRK